MVALHKPKRIALMLPKFSQYGGVEQFGYRLAEALGQKGYAVDFICARKEADAPRGVRVISVGRFGITRWLKLAWFLYKCEQIRQQGQYDLSISLGKNLRQDIIRMGGGPLDIYWQKSEQALPAGWQRWWKMLTRKCSPVNWLIKLVEHKQFTAQAQVIAVSHLVRTWLLEAYPLLDPRNVSVIYNKPDLSRFFPATSDEKVGLRQQLWQQYPAVSPSISDGAMPADAIYVGTATTNFILKGVAPLIESLAHLPDAVHLFVAGGRQHGKYASLAKRLGVGHRVHFCGKVMSMPELYQALDIFILPTFYDACSNAVLEALAAGCKTISSQSNGSSYFLPESSVLKNPGDAAEIAQKIQEHMEHNASAPFTFPEDVPSGIACYLDVIEAKLAEKA